VLGQYLGFIIILALSMVGYLAGLVIPEQVIGLLGLAPIYIGVRQLLRGRDNASDDEVGELADQPKPQMTSWLATFLHPKTYSVAVVTVANGGDNISVYIPLLAGKTLPALGVTLIIFMILIGVWCFLGDRLGSNPILARLIQHYGHLLVPFVLIGLGIYILIESELLQ
jgi:cadmium resistance protein CadD (predicted permease)